MKCTFEMWLVHLIWLFHSSVSVMVVKHPSPWSSWVEMETAQVDCVFDSFVGCAWYRNGTVVKIIQRYEYKYPSTDQGSKDCSIFIRNSTLNDSGWWQCSNKIDSQGNPLIRSNPGWISIRPLEIMVQPQRMLKVKRNAPNVLLQCEFNAEVNCSWMRNGITTENGFNYWDRKFRTKTCTILFTDILYSTHSGNWSCSNYISGSTGRIINSIVAQVYVEEPLVLDHPPNELLVNLGKIAVLLCIWDVRVVCRWKHNSMTVAGYKYSYNKRDSNCSLVIRGVGVEDEGVWKCVDGQNETTTSKETKISIVNQPRPLIFGCSKDLLCSRGASEAFKEQDTAMYCQSSDAHPPAVLYWDIQPLDSDIDFTFRSKQQQNRQNPNGTYNSVLKLSPKNFDYLTANFKGFNVFCTCEHLSRKEKVLVLHFPRSLLANVAPTTATTCVYESGTEVTSCAPPTTPKPESQLNSASISLYVISIIFVLTTLGLSGFIMWDKCIKKKSTVGRSDSATSRNENKNTPGGIEMKVKASNRRDGPEEEPGEETASLLNEEI